MLRQPENNHPHFALLEAKCGFLLAAVFRLPFGFARTMVQNFQPKPTFAARLLRYRPFSYAPLRYTFRLSVMW